MADGSDKNFVVRVDDWTEATELVAKAVVIASLEMVRRNPFDEQTKEEVSRIWGAYERLIRG